MYANKEEQIKAEKQGKTISNILTVAAIGGSIIMGLIYLNKFGWVTFYSC